MNAQAGIQATAFMNSAGNKVASESKGFVQGFSLPGEAEKAAKILQSFLGMCLDDALCASTYLGDLTCARSFSRPG